MKNLQRLKSLRHELSSLLAAYNTVEEGIKLGKIEESDVDLFHNSNGRLAEILCCVQNEISSMSVKPEEFA